MLSITPIAAAQASTYYAQTDGYYSEQETAPSKWHGQGAAMLGLSGGVDSEQFTNLLDGKSPDGSRQLIEGSRANSNSHRAGYDLTFSSPKSVSVLALVQQDERLIQAHDEAVRATLSYAESRYAETRQYIDGRQQRVQTANWTIATFQHTTSRELDPQLHSHCVILNVTQRDDGEWRAIRGEKLLAAKMELGAAYRNELAARVQQLGYEIDWRPQGLWEIRGVSQATLEAFSRRSEQIQAEVERLRSQYPVVDESRLREWATLGSRHPKQVGIDTDTLRQAWQERAQLVQGQDLQTLIAEARLRSGELDRSVARASRLSGQDARDIVRLAAERLSESESIFTRAQWMQTSSQLAAGKATTEQLSRAIEELSAGRKDRAECPLLGRRTDGEQLFTTSAIFRAERAVVDYARQGRGTQEPVMTPERAEQVLSATQLSADQRDAARGILTSGDRIVLVQGDAGTGKTTMLRFIRDAAEAAGWTVRGVAYTGQAARELREHAGIDADTVHKFLAQVGDPSPADRSPGKELWIIDESSMLGSRHMKELIERADARDAKLILVGDTKQLAAIGSGRLFAELQERGVAQTYYLTQIKRQVDPSYKETVEAMAAKKIDAALSRLERDGRLHEYAGHLTDRAERDQAKADAHQTIASAYAERVHAGHEVLAVSLYRDDARKLNAAIRAVLQQRGLVGTEHHSWLVRDPKNIGPTEKGFAASYQIGDTLVCLVPHRDQEGHGWRPGTVATVRAVDQSTNALTVEVATKRGTAEIRQIHLTATVGPGGKQQADYFAAYESREAQFSQADTVVFLKNDRQIDVRNGQRGKVLDVSAAHMAVQLSDGRIVSFGASECNYLAHGYAVTDYKSQGATTQTVLVHADAGQQPRSNAEGHVAPPRANYQSFYVALTRGREDVQVYTPDIAELRRHASMEARKTSSLDRDQAGPDVASVPATRVDNQLVAATFREPAALRREEASQASRNADAADRTADRHSTHAQARAPEGKDAHSQLERE
jgi:conjugative relaxase-like TrwC/TraI family protein